MPSPPSPWRTTWTPSKSWQDPVSGRLGSHGRRGLVSSPRPRPGPPPERTGPVARPPRRHSGRPSRGTAPGTHWTGCLRRRSEMTAVLLLYACSEGHGAAQTVCADAERHSTCLTSVLKDCDSRKAAERRLCPNKLLLSYLRGSCCAGLMFTARRILMIFVIKCEILKLVI